MRKEEKDRLFKIISDSIADTLSKKDHDYGDSFHDVYSEFGDVSTYIRLSDKLGRMKTLTTKFSAKVENEPLEDVLRDIAGYCILTLASKERIKMKQESESCSDE